MNASAFPLSPPPHASASPEGHELFTIGELAREFSTTLRALRFYEDKGLISPRREGMTRLYTVADRERLSVILKGKHLGFTLAEIRALVAAHAPLKGNAPDISPPADVAESGLALTRDRCLKQLAQLERQRSEIDSAIHELKSLAESMPA